MFQPRSVKEGVLQVVALRHCFLQMAEYVRLAQFARGYAWQVPDLRTPFICTNLYASLKAGTAVHERGRP